MTASPTLKQALVFLVTYCVLFSLFLRSSFVMKKCSTVDSLNYVEVKNHIPITSGSTVTHSGQGDSTGEPQSLLGSSSERTYAYVFFYVGQQGAAIRGIASLQCFLTSLKLPFLLVEPQVSHDVWGYTNYTDYMMLSDMFDLEDFAGHSDNVELVDKNGFVQNNPNRTVILFPGGTKPATFVVCRLERRLSRKTQPRKDIDRKLRHNEKAHVRTISRNNVCSLCSEDSQAACVWQ